MSTLLPRFHCTVVHPRRHTTSVEGSGPRVEGRAKLARAACTRENPGLVVCGSGLLLHIENGQAPENGGGGISPMTTHTRAATAHTQGRPVPTTSVGVKSNGVETVYDRIPVRPDDRGHMDRGFAPFSVVPQSARRRVNRGVGVGKHAHTDGTTSCSRT